MQALLTVNKEQWQAEMDSVSEYLESYGARLPGALRKECDEVIRNLQESQ